MTLNIWTAIMVIIIIWWIIDYIIGINKNYPRGRK